MIPSLSSHTKSCYVGNFVSKLARDQQSSPKDQQQIFYGNQNTKIMLHKILTRHDTLLT